jgi:hypothetical protein
LSPISYTIVKGRRLGKQYLNRHLNQAEKGGNGL